jgi:hypothetical protein
MNTISRKLHEIQKQSAIEEPTEARLFVDNDKEMQLHKTAQQILERHMQNLEEFKNNLDGSICPVLTEQEQALVDESSRFMLKRFLLLFQQFAKTFITLGDPTAEHVFWVRFMWLIEESQKFAVQARAENEVLDSPDFFSLCVGEQDRRLKPVYDKWDKNLFTEKSYHDYVEQHFKTFKLPPMSKAEIEEVERQEQADIEFDRQVLKEKCPTCSNPCDWYEEELKKMSQNVARNQGDKNGK